MPRMLRTPTRNELRDYPTRTSLVQAETMESFCHRMIVRCYTWAYRYTGTVKFAHPYAICHCILAVLPDEFPWAALKAEFHDLVDYAYRPIPDVWLAAGQYRIVPEVLMGRLVEAEQELLAAEEDMIEDEEDPQEEEEPEEDPEEDPEEAEEPPEMFEPEEAELEEIEPMEEPQEDPEEEPMEAQEDGDFPEEYSLDGEDYPRF